MKQDKEHTVFDVAKWFAGRKKNGLRMKKLQKLCYYAQAWSLALYDKPLFKGKFRAWVHGPVNKKLWKEFQDISYRKITVSDFKDPERDLKFQSLQKEEKEFLRRVWATYGQYSGSELEILTHRERPWLEQRTGLNPFENSDRVISPESMRDFYRGLYIQGDDA
ncbi:MAG: DUF4065 domain-containing protein [Oscillibacter sp.]|nr:DUF4065 domain-containing protein [Oscillibacter sp.]